MDKYTATEPAYQNGYEQGKKDAVVYGRWEFNETGYQCSKCQCDSLCDGWNHPVRSKFCPNCGAQMDGE